MSRLGDLIRLERTRQNLTYKQVARKCGVSDKYLMEVEAGTRIIGDDQARRILKTIGMKEQTEADFTLDDIAATVDLQSAVPQLGKAVEEKKLTKKEKRAGDDEPGVAGSIWLDALSGVLKHVPVYNAVMKEVDHRLLPASRARTRTRCSILSRRIMICAAFASCAGTICWSCPQPRRWTGQSCCWTRRRARFCAKPAAWRAFRSCCSATTGPAKARLKI